MTIHFERELDRLKKRILSLGARVEERVRMAIKAMESRDRKLAKKVIEADHEIDQIEVDV
ncbi:MAG: phosphate transport system regulatory protein PhoU, partial [Deltaproteobacteria bacterium]|nr:phosphate transport system regulatory protein PhoU [Deltaproteobacteria bacterium]